MASPSHAVMLREISAAGDRESTGALDIAWDAAQASLFFKFGRPRHAVFTAADGRSLTGEDALTALVAELPADIEVTSWRRAKVTEETLDLTAAELIALLDPREPEDSNGTAHSSPGPDAGLPEPATGAAPPRPAFGMAHFPLLPLGPVLWSDAMANVVDLEAMLPLLPNCLLVLTLPEPQAAALVADGAITDAVWMTGGHGLLGDTAARALMDSREGKLTAYRIDDPRMSAVLRTLLADPAALVVPAGEVDALPTPATDTEVTAPADQRDGGGEATAAEAPPTFDLAFEYVGLPDRENGAPASAVDQPPPPPEVRAQTEPSTWSPRQTVPPSAEGRLQSSFGPVGVLRSPREVAVRVLATLGVYALSWQKRSNLELEAFDDNLPVRKPRSTTSSVMAWLLALVITVAGAVLFASTRQSIHLPFGRQLTNTEAYYLIGGLACLYLIVILPFNMAAATANLRRIRQVQQRAGISSRARVPLGSARLMVIPVIGRLVLLGLEQRAINSIWNAARIADAPGVDVAVDRSPVVAGAHDAAISAATEAAGESALSAVTEAAADSAAEAAEAIEPAQAVEPAFDSGPAGQDTTAASAEGPVSSDAIAASDTAPPSPDAIAVADTTPPSADDAATEYAEELAAIFSEMQSQPVWMRIAAPVPEDAASSEATAVADAELSADTMVTDDVDASVVEPTEPGEPALSVVPAEPEPTAADEPAPSIVAAEPDEPALFVVAAEPDEPPLSVVAAEPDESASDDSAPRADPVWFHIPTPPADEIAEPPELTAFAATEPEPDFVAPRLDIDVDGLRQGLNQIAVKWLGADDVAPVAAAIAAARPGVDDFVAAIAAIRAMDIPGRESPIVRAMAREMHYYATEVLCAA
jgi:hypothetical protein